MAEKAGAAFLWAPHLQRCPALPLLLWHPPACPLRFCCVLLFGCSYQPLHDRGSQCKPQNAARPRRRSIFTSWRRSTSVVLLFMVLRYGFAAACVYLTVIEDVDGLFTISRGMAEGNRAATEQMRAACAQQRKQPKYARPARGEQIVGVLRVSVIPARGDNAEFTLSKGDPLQ